MKYAFSSRIRYSEAGADGKLTLDHLVDYFQDCSAFQSEEVGYGPKVWLHNRVGWVLVAWRIRIYEYPSLMETVTAATWPHSFHTIEADRNFNLTAEDGRILAEADSRWVYFDMDKMKPMRVPQEEVEAYGINEPLALGKYPKHIIMPKEAETREPIAIQLSQLDTNHHVNNREYVRMAMAYLPDGFDCGELLVDYHAQAMAGDVIYPRIAVTDSGRIMSLEKADGKAFAVVEFRSRS